MPRLPDIYGSLRLTGSTLTAQVSSIEHNSSIVRYRTHSGIVPALIPVYHSSSFPWLFPSFRVAGMTADLPSPHRPVRLPTRSRPRTFHVFLARVFPGCFRLSSLPFSWNISSQHFPQNVFFVSHHHMPVPVQSACQ